MYILSCRAFCNPADVESFTEEKKQSLLIKCQGKGADFVRAVQEIIDSYEKLKKQDQVYNFNSADRVTQANYGNSVDSSASKDLADTSKATLEFRFETSNAVTNHPSLATEVAEAEVKIGALGEKESISDQPSDTMLVKETPVLTTYSSRKRSGGLRSQKSVAQQKAPPVRRARSSSRVESSRFQNFMMLSNDVRTADDVSANVIQNGSLRRDKRVRKSTDASESDDVDSSVLMSNDSMDDNGSEIATVDSDAVSLNEGSTTDSSYKPEHSETVIDCLEGDVELSKWLDFQIKAVVLKKKGNQLESDQSLEQMSPLSSCRNDSPTDRDSLVLKGALANVSLNVSPSNSDTQVQGSMPEPCKEVRNQLGCLAGGEAALPPCKRLHRALEAMSANAAEEDLACAEHLPTMKTSDDRCRCHGSPIRSCSHITVEDKEANGLEQCGVDLLVNSDSDIFSVSNPIPSGKCAKSSLEPDICSQPAKSPNNQKHEFHKDAFVEPMNRVSHDKGQNLEHSSPNPDKIHATFRPNCGSSDQQLPSKDDSGAEPVHLSNFRAENPDEQFNTSEHADMCSDPVIRTAGKVSPEYGSNAFQGIVVHTSNEKSESLKSQTDDSSVVNSMCEVAEEFQPEKRQKTSSLICGGNSDKDVLGVRPNVHSCPNKSLCASVTDNEGKADSAASERPKSVSKCSIYTEAHAALSPFENMLATLTRTKESIARVTRIAIDCAKFGVSAKVVEIVARNLELESSLHRRVDLFFLVDSITQCSWGLKGDVGGIYPSAIQATLPRLHYATAPPGPSAQENRRKCLKVLRLWLERRILPESVVRHHIRELDSLCVSSSGGAFSRCSARTERVLDDPVRDMEGMLVDEYGSSSSFQLPGFCMPRMLKDEDEGSDSDGGSFEAVTPEHYSGTPEEQEANTTTEKHRHILEDVDGELEMEDVAPEIEMSSNNGAAGVNTARTSRKQCDQHFPLPFAPPLPHDMPPSSPPLPSSPPPPRPPPPPPIPPCPFSDPYGNVVDSTIHTMNNIQQPDGPNFHHNAYPPQPLHPAPSNQFSYVNSGQQMNSMRDAPPPPYSNRYFSPNIDGGKYYNSHERMKLASNQLRESWRFPPPPFSGPRYADKAKPSYGHGSYGGPQCEPPRLPN
ncbi:hypothetical protein CRYUN_Cryun20dG0070900 [Craigia yunnanensis]